jgi:hypothetical protein
MNFYRALHVLAVLASHLLASWQLNLRMRDMHSHGGGEERSGCTYQRHGVDGADDDGRQPESDDSAAGVGEDSALVLDGVPLSRE